MDSNLQASNEVSQVMCRGVVRNFDSKMKNYLDFFKLKSHPTRNHRQSNRGFKSWFYFYYYIHGLCQSIQKSVAFIKEARTLWIRR